MPLVQITLTQGRPSQTVRTMISKVTQAIVEAGVAPKENIRVLVHEIPQEHFAAGDVTIAERLTDSGSQAHPSQPTTQEGA